MARINYREAVQRFTHIDARFVACEVGMPGKDGFFTVELYPWWEHPLYIAARETGANWGFTGLTKDAYRPVTVYPKRVHTIHLSNPHWYSDWPDDGDISDWEFTQDHPLLWEFEQSLEITCNSPMSLDQWMEITEAVRNGLTDYRCRIRFAEYLPPDNIYRFGKSGSFSLGQFPRPLFNPICRELTTRGFSYFAQSDLKLLETPEELDADAWEPVLFLIDNTDYIIAGDFEIDVPEFIHKPEWFQPHGTPTRTEE